MTQGQEEQVSEAQIAVHWGEEEYYQPSVKFIGQANAALGENLAVFLGQVLKGFVGHSILQITGGCDGLTQPANRSRIKAIPMLGRPAGTCGDERSSLWFAAASDQ